MVAGTLTWELSVGHVVDKAVDGAGTTRAPLLLIARQILVVAVDAGQRAHGVSLRQERDRKTLDQLRLSRGHDQKVDLSRERAKHPFG